MELGQLLRRRLYRVIRISREGCYAWSNVTSFSGGVAPTVIQDLGGDTVEDTDSWTLGCFTSKIAMVMAESKSAARP